MPKLVFVTVGTSALENCLPGFAEHQQNATIVEHVAGLLRDNAERWQGVLLNPKPAAGLPQRQGLVHNLRQGLKSFEKAIGRPNMLAQSRRVSAEVASLLMLGREPDVGVFGKDDEIYLLPSETDVGIICAEANCIVLQEKFPAAKFERTAAIAGISFVGVEGKDLLDQFVGKGLPSLETIIRDKVQRFKTSHGSGANYIMDVTGGFKGLLLFAPIICMRYLDKLFYFYQEAKRPIRLNRAYYSEQWNNDQAALNRWPSVLPDLPHLEP